MGSVVIGVIGTLLGVLLAGTFQLVQGRLNRRWQQEDLLGKRRDLLSDVKRAVYAEYLRAISGSYAQALARQREPSENGKLLAATAEIEILSRMDVAGPASDLTTTVMAVHSKIAQNPEAADELVPDVNRRRYELIDLFKADLGLPPRR